MIGLNEKLSKAEARVERLTDEALKTEKEFVYQLANKAEADVARLSARIEKLEGIQDTFVSTLKPAYPFVGTPGGEWVYQKSDTVLEQLGDELPKHHALWCDRKKDKSHPLFLALSGPGTGKSRLLDELPDLARDAVDARAREAKARDAVEAKQHLARDAIEAERADLAAVEANRLADLAATLADAHVFSVSFENGSRPAGDGSEGDDANLLIGTRMMWQFADQLRMSFDEFQHKRQYRISDALKELERLTGKPRHEQAVFLLVDGLQRLQHELQSKTSVLAGAITSVCNIVNAGPEFVVGVLAATVHVPINHFLSNSPQTRVFLQPPAVDGAFLVEKYGADEPGLRLLVGDMGGHGRALELLEEVVREHPSRPLPLAKVANKLYHKLIGKYDNWIAKSTALFGPVVTAVLARSPFMHELDTVADGIAVEEVLGLGLVRWAGPNTPLDLSYVALWLMATDEQKLDLMLGDYESVEASLLQKNGRRDWRAWERLVASFRGLKSVAFAGEDVKLSDLHAGALLSDAAKRTDVRVRVRCQRVVEAVSKQNASAGNVKTTDGEEVDMSSGEFVALNAHGAAAADVWSRVDIVPAEEGGVATQVSEAIACRRRKQKLDEKSFDKEREKACSGDDDVFIFFQAGPVADDVKERVESDDQRRLVVVGEKQMSAYFGVFAGRAFLLRPPAPLSDK